MNTTPSSVLYDAEHLAALLPDIMLDAETLAHSAITGLHGRRRAGTGETFWQHRPYISGDPVSSIDWRQSARSTGMPFIRQNEWEAAASIWLWRDPSQSMVYTSRAPLPQKRYRASVLVTAISIILSHMGERIGVLRDADHRHASGGRLYHGRQAPHYVLENLEHGTFETTDLPDGSHLRPGAFIILASDFLFDPAALAKSIGAYQAKGASGILLEVLDPSERDFTFRGRTEFHDLETPDRLLFGDAGGLKARYLSAMEDHQEALSRISKQCGWPFIQHYTDDDAIMPLQTLINFISARRDTP